MGGGIEKDVDRASEVGIGCGVVEIHGRMRREWCAVEQSARLAAAYFCYWSFRAS
jgi:hypothetical protein